MSISPRSKPPGALSTRNQSPRSERADGGFMREPTRGAGDTPASAAARNKSLQEDVGRNQRQVMSGISAPTAGPLQQTVQPVGGSGGPDGGSRPAPGGSGERRHDVGNGR